MATWTQIWNGKTRPVKQLPAPEKKANGKNEDRDLDEIEVLENEIKELKETIAELRTEAKFAEYKFNQITHKENYLNEQLVYNWKEIDRLRGIIDSNTRFMQEVVIGLVNRPAAAAPAGSQSPAERLAAARAAMSRDANKADTSNPSAGPKGNIP